MDQVDKSVLEQNQANEALEKGIKEIKRQRWIDLIAFFFTGYIIIFLLKFVARYRIKNIQEVRKQYKEITKLGKPIIVCANHLTMIDSIIMEWAFAPVWWYILNFKYFAWNIPAIENFKSSFTSSLVTYLGKCIPIDRKGGKEHMDLILGKVNYLLKLGDVFMIFPEGTRSRSGKVEVDQVTYGVGKIIQDIEKECVVICVYLRGSTQIAYDARPHDGDEIYLKMDHFIPDIVQHQGRRGQKEISTQIINRIKAMELEYFEKYPERAKSILGE